MSEWQPIETAPRDGTTILVFGQPKDIELVGFRCPGVHTAAWDEIDSAFCLTGGTWLGPFIYPTHWQSCPSAPDLVTP